MVKGIGGMGNLFKQAQEIQAKLTKIQEELARKTVEASSGGGMVRVTVNGQFVLSSVRVDPAVINPQEREMLEDLILAAVNEGLRQAREMVSEEMSKVTGGFKIPGLMP
ncbi:MAG: YbaB/EbfC family nucleoid-associated protein [Candidatus Binatota bacterium]|jgi:DNA-binding YbaB/EbfC family protein|nr:YbaB/EbfC family nucleoid-associated protein [Deltaproteobacteria bacterium]